MEFWVIGKTYLLSCLDVYVCLSLTFVNEVFNSRLVIIFFSRNFTYLFDWTGLFLFQKSKNMNRAKYVVVLKEAFVGWAKVGD